MSYRPVCTAAAVALVLATAFTTPLLAQCSDGSPPPCRAAAAIARASTRPPDPRTWVVLPFANVTREPEVAWLTDAAVNLLYLDLSRWTDIRVVDDGRVADVVRGLPAAERSQIGLNTGLSVARRLGAGRLVMGDLVRGGASTTVLAKVYDVASGRRLRTAQDEFVSRESTMPAFARLAGRVVDAPLPPGTSRDAVGTTSLDAYQEYVSGLRALGAWDLDSARARFERAIRHDSTFALAHYRLSVTLGWISGPTPDPEIAGAAAARFASGLPARERSLIRGNDQFTHRRYKEACDTFKGMVAADSQDVEAWYQIGECSFHDGVWIPSPDSTSWRPSGDYTMAYRAFQRTLALAPDMHLAYEHLIDLLRMGTGSYCLANRCRVRALVLRRLIGDSIATTLQVHPQREPVPWTPEHEAVKQANLVAADSIAQRWLAAAPNEAEAHYQYAMVLSDRKHFVQAASEAATARRLGIRAQPGLTPAGFHIAQLIRADSENSRTIPLAVRIADSVTAGLIPLHFFAEDSAQRVFPESATKSALAGLIGQPSRVPARMPAPPWSRGAIPDGYYRAVASVASGIVPRDLESILARLSDTAQASALAPSGLVLGYLCAGLCTIPESIADSAWRATPVALAAAGDTARARAALATVDSMIRRNLTRGGVDQEFAFQSVLAHLAVLDTAGAIASLRTYNGEMYHADLGGFYYGYGLGSNVWQLGRAWLLTADLLAATGKQDESRVFYRRVMDLWASADPEYQPMVQRARAALPEFMR